MILEAYRRLMAEQPYHPAGGGTLTADPKNTFKMLAKLFKSRGFTKGKIVHPGDKNNQPQFMFTTPGGYLLRVTDQKDGSRTFWLIDPHGKALKSSRGVNGIIGYLHTRKLGGRPVEKTEADNTFTLDEIKDVIAVAFLQKDFPKIDAATLFEFIKLHKRGDRARSKNFGVTMERYDELIKSMSSKTESQLVSLLG